MKYKECVGLWMRLRMNEGERDVGGYDSSEQKPISHASQYRALDAVSSAGR